VRRTHVSARVSAAIVALVLGAAASARAQLVPSGQRSEITIDNFGRVSDRYYRGAQPAGHDYQDLAALGVKTVIDLTADGDVNEAGLVRAAGMKFFRIPMTTHDEPARNAVTRFLSLVNDPANQPVYVHCQGGRHRTGVMTAVYRMTQDGWNADRAFAEMQKYRFGPAFLHSTLKNFVYDYYAHIDRAAVAAARATTATKAGS
jgi:tyrosine-protein phosphatase SIW14